MYPQTSPFVPAFQPPSSWIPALICPRSSWFKDGPPLTQNPPPSTSPHLTPTNPVDPPSRRPGGAATRTSPIQFGFVVVQRTELFDRLSLGETRETLCILNEICSTWIDLNRSHPTCIQTLNIPKSQMQHNRRSKTSQKRNIREKKRIKHLVLLRHSCAAVVRNVLWNMRL